MEAIKSNKDELISLKKSERYSQGIPSKSLKFDDEALKGMRLEEGYIYPVINTTNFMDSHNDVHIDGIWNKSIKDQQGKVYYVSDHNLSITNVIAYAKDVEMILKSFSFQELGFNYPDKTQALVFKIKKESIRLSQAKEIIEERIPIEHSIRMQYVNLKLCADYSGDDWEDERENWAKYYPMVANKERADEVGYFWAVTEAKISREGSMLLAGSNPVTPLLQKDIEPESSTQKQEPSNYTDTQKQFLTNLI